MVFFDAYIIPTLWLIGSILLIIVPLMVAMAYPYFDGTQSNGLDATAQRS